MTCKPQLRHNSQQQPQQQLRQALRQQIRALRQQLSPSTQQQAALDLASHLLPYIQQQQFRKIALYLAFDGELNTQPLIEQLWQAKIDVYLPCLHPFSQGNLLFLHYHQHSIMVRNPLQILEPKLELSAVLPAHQLDLICTPLVAFDPKGNRLGMGGGFYDRTLAQLPELMTIGLAHDCQQVSALPIAAWDQPIHAVFTPSQQYFYRT